MGLLSPRLLLALTAALCGLAVYAGPASAALTCAPDPFEVDTALTAAPIAPGETVTRAICQEPLPFPRMSAGVDGDYFVFTATEGKSYTAEVTSAGAAIAGDAFGVGIARLNADGSTSTVEQNWLRTGDRTITAPLAAGRYQIYAATSESQIYLPANVMDIKTVQGPEGIYSVRLTENATATAAPYITSLRLSTTSVKGGSSLTGTYTLSSPAPAGGMYVDVSSSHVYNATPGVTYAPAGATRVTFPIRTRASSTDLRVTLTAWARVGPRVSATLTVRR